MMIMDQSDNEMFNAENIRAYFEKIGELAAERGQQYEIAVFGGSALALCFEWRDSTHDIDYMMVRGAESELSEIANEAAMAVGRPLDGLRSDVTIFAADHPELIPQGDYPPNHASGGLRVLVASPEYLLSMKVLSMRSSLETQDCWDVWNLLDVMEIEPENALQRIKNIVQDFYPDRELPLRNQRILEDILDEKKQNHPYRRDIGW